MSGLARRSGFGVRWKLTFPARSSVDIPYSEGPVNLNWTAIMKTVNDDPYDFFKEGGWSFLGEKEDENGSSDDDSEESEFNASSDDAASSESGSDFGSDDDASADEGSGDSEDDGESSVASWDEQETRLAKKEMESTLGKKGGKSKKYDSDSGSASSASRGKKKSSGKKGRK